jgi:TrmH family RNA methyltransferase
MLTKATIKDIQSLQHKKFRNEQQAFIAEGPKLVEELLVAGIFTCKCLVALESWSGWTTHADHIQTKTETYPVEAHELERVSAQSTPNQVLGVFEMKTYEPPVNVSGKITLVLDDIQDPGNLGTIIRSADWFGVEYVICSLHTADVYNPKVVQSTMASLARVKVVYCDLENWLSQMKQVPIYATSMHGESLSKIQFNKEGIIIIGNEGNGISKTIEATASNIVSIPKIGGAESLNAAVAASIMLYALTR